MAGYYELILLLYFKQWMKCVLALESSNMHFVPYTYVRICIIKPGAHVRPARAWFLRIASVRELQYVCLCVCVCVCMCVCVCVCVCVSTPEAINS